MPVTTTRTARTAAREHLEASLPWELPEPSAPWRKLEGGLQYGYNQATVKICRQLDLVIYFASTTAGETYYIFGERKNPEKALKKLHSAMPNVDPDPDLGGRLHDLYWNHAFSC